MGDDHRGLSAEAEMKILEKIDTEILLLVVGEAPEEASHGVTNPEDSMDQHGSEVLPADPVTLDGE